MAGQDPASVLGPTRLQLERDLDLVDVQLGFGSFVDDVEHVGVDAASSASRRASAPGRSGIRTRKDR